MSVRALFTDAQLEAVRRATARAEARTAGEIVVVVAGRCDAYEQGLWKAATLGGLALALAAAAWSLWSGAWPGAIELWIALPPVAGAAAGYFAARWLGSLRLALVPADLIATRVARAAAQAFLEEEVFATRDRSGVLIFVAAFERRVEIVADSGINALVGPAAWSDLAERLTAGIRAGRAAEALVEAVEACGRLLEEHGLARRRDDTDELADGVRLRDE